MPSVLFHSEDVTFKPAHSRKTATWIKRVIQSEKHELKQLNYIFCSDEHLLQINMDYLGHKTYTDIITFDNSEENGTIEGDIFISIDRVRENAGKFGVSFQDELDRVVVHGALHLLGYSDKTESKKKQMRKKEDAYLSLR